MRTVVVTAVLSLALAAPAQAKELMGLTVCGASGCASERGEAVAALDEGQGGPMADGPVVAPAEAGPYYRAIALVGDGRRAMGGFTFYFVPDSQKFAFVDDSTATVTWHDAAGAWKDVAEALAGRVEPFATPTVTKALVDGKRADDPQSYLRLFELSGEPQGYPRGDDLQQIRLESARPSPWTAGSTLVFSRSAHVLLRDADMVDVPADVASRLAEGASLDTGGRAFPWVAVAVAVALAALVAAAMLVAGRAPARRPQAGTT